MSDMGRRLGPILFPPTGVGLMGGDGVGDGVVGDVTVFGAPA